MTELRPFKCQGHLVTQWLWPLTCDLEKVSFKRYYSVMCNLEIRLCYSHCVFFIGLRNLLSEPPSLKQEYRLQYSKSRCGVTVDFIVVRIISFFTICHSVLMSEMKLKLPRQKHEFQKFSETVSSFCLWQPFKPQPKPKPECVKKMSCEPQMVTIYISYDNNWLSYGKCKIWLKSFSPGNVVEDVISMWHISLLRVITVPCHQETQY